VAIQSGLKIESVILEEGSYLDIGTPEDLVNAVRNDDLNFWRGFHDYF
jgi:hypothetical protein